MDRVSFVAGEFGDWRIDRIDAIAGAPLPAAPRLARIEGTRFERGGAWLLHGVRSNPRYTTRAEQTRLAGAPDLGRPSATCGALIAIDKSPAWWALPQDERRAIFERHTPIGLDYLAAVARRLYHGRDVGGEFDFLTWFEFADADRAMFDELVARLRASEEWRHVTREVDVRVSRRA